MNKETVDIIRKFIADRDWDKFHSPAIWRRAYPLRQTSCWNVFSGVTRIMIRSMSKRSWRM